MPATVSADESAYFGRLILWQLVTYVSQEFVVINLRRLNIGCEGHFNSEQIRQGSINVDMGLPPAGGLAIFGGGFWH
jgi:hypothetical protein